MGGPPCQVGATLQLFARNRCCFLLCLEPCPASLSHLPGQVGCHQGGSLTRS